jgi:Zn-dependent protease/CBS domain-containing protein
MATTGEGSASTSEGRLTTEPRSPLGGGLRLGTAFGVPIHVDWSLLIIFLLIAVNLALGLFPAWHPEWSAALTWGVALAAAVLFFASVLAHELSHAVVARWRGIPVSSITLFIFGGVAHMEDEPKSPKDEFLMAAVGPLVSVVIGVLATLAAYALAGDALARVDPNEPGLAMHAIGPLATLLLWLGPVNVVLGLFNLVPGFPLDGGRVARSIAWWATGDLVKATRWAAGAGRVFAWVLMGIGVVELLTGDAVQGVWLLLIGWFLNNAAQMSYAQVLVQRALDDVPVTRIMYTRVGTLTADVSVEAFVRDYLLATDQECWPVVDDDGRLLGLVTMDDVRRVSQVRWSVTLVSEIMTPADELDVLPPSANAERALRLLSRRDVEQVPVIGGGRVLGFVRRRDLVRWMSLQGPERAASPSRMAA